jgi:hypothetical protein
MTLSETIARDLLTIESDLGSQYFTWDNADYVCIVGASVESVDLGVGGFGGDTIKPVMVRKNLFSDGVYPTKADIVTLDGIDYEVNKITNDATKTFLHLDLIEPKP